MAELKENCIEWLSGDDVVYCTLSQRKYVNRVRSMAKKHANSVEILSENPDGSIFAKVPLDSVHLTIYSPRGVGFSAKPKEVDADE